MLIYLADLVHNYYPGTNTVPLNIAYIAAYAKKVLGDDVNIRLFKYCDDILNAIDEQTPDLLGLTNYSWNESLNEFVGDQTRELYPDIPIVMGGPNIRNERDGIRLFLEAHSFVDMYLYLAGEVPFANLLKRILLNNPEGKISPSDIRGFEINSVFSLFEDELKGSFPEDKETDLDYIPSPYLTGFLDEFLVPEFIPMFETNRGCPYTCTFCAWGVSQRRQVKQFSMERVKAELAYVAKKGVVFDYWLFADANFGILSRDLDIAKEIRNIYEEYHPFHSVVIWWTKNVKDYIVEIAKVLKGLSNAYVAFQTFDPAVEKLIKRKNISINQLLEFSEKLAVISERFHTDILLGMPGETFSSHLNSLSRAYELGFDSIGGGEIRLLQGTEMELPESRNKHNIKTKYRLIQEGFGVYRGKFIAEVEESVRSTNWINEDEMLRLRVLRALFYGAITIGEFGLLMKYLKSAEINIINFFQELLIMKDLDPISSESIDWLQEKARIEWFETKEDALNYYSRAENLKNLLENPTVKLNYDFMSFLMMSPKRYNAFYSLIFIVLKRKYSFLDFNVVTEILEFCKNRNYVARLSAGKKETEVFFSVSEKMKKFLQENNLFHSADKVEGASRLSLKIDSLLAESIKDLVEKNSFQIQAISLALQRYDIYMKPVIFEFSGKKEILLNC